MHTGDRGDLKRRVRNLRRELKSILTRHAGKAARYRYSRRFARNLLKVWPARWAFDSTDGVQPTNNHAERGLRGAVIYRNSHSAANPKTANDASNDCSRPTPPAAYNTARYTPTSSTCSAPIPAATRSRCSLNRLIVDGLNAYSNYFHDRTPNRAKCGGLRLSLYLRTLAFRELTRREGPGLNE